MIVCLNILDTAGGFPLAGEPFGTKNPVNSVLTFGVVFGERKLESGREYKFGRKRVDPSRAAIEKYRFRPLVVGL